MWENAIIPGFNAPILFVVDWGLPVSKSFSLSFCNTDKPSSGNLASTNLAPLNANIFILKVWPNKKKKKTIDTFFRVVLITCLLEQWASSGKCSKFGGAPMYTGKILLCDCVVWLVF